MDNEVPINIDSDGVPTPPPTDTTNPSPAQKKKRQMMPAFWYRWNRKTKILSTLALILILVAASAAVYTNFINKSGGKTQVTTTIMPDNRVASPLTGIKVDPALAKRPVTSIMIENSPDARPQSGLQDAGVVFEAIAEGGITRLLALFQDASPQYIGPVRSLRPYYIDFAAPFQASIVHVGGSPDALSEVQNGKYRNLDQFFNGSYFTRITARQSPHNVYTSFDQLDKLNQSKGYTSSQFISWPRKADKALATPAAKTIDVIISSTNFNVQYAYDASTNSYLRSEGGQPHMATISAADKTGQQLHPKVVIALVMPYAIVDSSGHSGYRDTGSGAAYFFEDGDVIQGTWSKADTSSQFVFYDSSGNPISLNAGQTWISIVSQTTGITYAP